MAEIAVGRPGMSALASPHRLRLLRGALGSADEGSEQQYVRVSIIVSVSTWHKVVDPTTYADVSW